ASLRRGRRCSDIDVLRAILTEPCAKAQQQRCASGRAATKDDGDAAGVKRPEDAAFEGRAFDDHERSVDARIGMSIPRVAAVSTAVGYPASTCRTTPMPGSHVRT